MKPMLSFEEAKQTILNLGTKLTLQQTEMISLNEATGKILAKPITSSMNVPAFNQSAMDGYAFRLNEIDLTQQNQFQVQGAIFAGDQTIQQWQPKTALRVMTGAPLPMEADLVVMQEQIEKNGEQIIFSPKNLKKGMNIRYLGENVKKGQILFEQDEKLTLPKLVTLASLGIDKVTVYRSLKVAIFSTGNELVSIGDPLLQAHTIYDSNRFMLQQSLNHLGCEVLDLGILPDDLSQIKQTLFKASQEADLIITSGGVSVGEADFTQQAVQALGQVDFWKIAIKPGKPFAFGQVNQVLFCGLPGNPVSAMVTFYQLVKPLIEQAQHQKTQAQLCLKNNWQVKTSSFLKKKPGRVDFQRGILSKDQAGNWQVQSAGQQESHLTTSFHQANCFIILEQERGNVDIGEMVSVECFDSILL